MRLLKIEDNGELSLTEFFGDGIPPYGILSHTWGADHDEVKFKDFLDNDTQSKPGYQKIQLCKAVSSTDGLQYFWVDTCCIDKSSSAELAEAINSMWRWYHNAAKCYVFLSDVSADDSTKESGSWKLAFQKSRWFTRGWTLQELLAPSELEFLSVEGVRLGDRTSLGSEIHNITGIPEGALQGGLFDFSIEERMAWAAGRQTKREEDAAYSLLGIFDVHMPLIYGEGRKKALARLHKEIRESLSETSVPKNKPQPPPKISVHPASPLDRSLISAVCPSKGRAAICALGGESDLRQLNLNNDSWLPAYWSGESGSFACAPIVISRRDGQFDMIALNSDGQVSYRTMATTQWSLFSKPSWESLGGTITSPLAVASWTPTRLDLFGIGVKGQVLHKALDYGNWLPSQQDWEELGGEFTGPPEVVSRTSGKLDVFCLKGTKLFHQWWTGSSWGHPDGQWGSFWGDLIYPVSAASSSPDCMDIFGIGTDNKMYHLEWKEQRGWSHFVPISSRKFIGKPSVVSTRPGCLDIFCLGDDHEIYHQAWVGNEREPGPSPLDWESLGGDFACAPTAVSRGSGKLELFCKGADNNVYQMDWEGKEWKSLGKVV